MSLFDVAASPEWMSDPARNCNPDKRADHETVRDFADRWFANGVYATADYAKKLCGGCPFALDCLDHAMRNREEGIWAGTTDAMRETIRRNARRNKGEVAA